MRRNKRFPKGNLGAGGIHSRRASEIKTGFPKIFRFLGLKIGVAHGSGMGQDVTDVGDAGEVHDHALEAQAEAGVVAATEMCIRDRASAGNGAHGSIVP